MTGSNFRSIREHLELSVEQLADILRVSAHQIIAWEHGMYQIPSVIIGILIIVAGYADRLFRFDRHGLCFFAPRS